MHNDDLKFFTMRIPTHLHIQMKSQCARSEITMKDFCLQAICYLMSSVDEEFKKTNDSTNKDLDSVKKEYLEWCTKK